MFEFIPKPIIKISLKGGKQIRIPLPTKNLYDKMTNTSDYLNLCDEVLSMADSTEEFTDEEKIFVYVNYLKIVSETVKKYTENIPYCPDKKENEVKYTVMSGTEKIVSNYTGLNFFELGNLNICDYWAFVKDAIIYNNLGTEQGRKHLEDCWLYSQTEPDRVSLRELKKKLERGK